jgi:hypothetical protein
MLVVAHLQVLAESATHVTPPRSTAQAPGVSCGRRRHSHVKVLRALCASCSACEVLCVCVCAQRVMLCGGVTAFWLCCVAVLWTVGMHCACTAGRAAAVCGERRGGDNS